MGTEDQRTRGTVGTEDQGNSANRGLVGTEDQKNSWNRGPEEQWAQRTGGYREPVATDDQRNSGIRGLVGTEDQRKSGNKGHEGTRWDSARRHPKLLKSYGCM